MRHTLSMTIILTALAVGGCGSKGEKLAQEYCDCVAANKQNPVACAGKLAEYRDKLTNDLKENLKFVEKTLACASAMTK